MRKIFTEELPKRGERISWMDSVGLSIPFSYDGTVGELQIIDYLKIGGRGHLKVSYDEGNPVTISTNSILQGKIGHIVFPSEDRYKIGEIVNNGTKAFLIISSSQVNRYGDRYYQCKCLNCQNDTPIREQLLSSGGDCPICCASPRILVQGYNDMATTAPWMVEYLVDKKESLVNFKSSSKKILFKCPLCGEQKISIINNVYKRGFSCPKCGDGFSYSEKFVNCLLRQLNIDFVSQKIFTWATDKRYDFYIPSLNMIVETHGRQHYEGEIVWGQCDPKEVQLNDKHKEELANKNGIQNYIVINCKRSELNWVKTNIEDSLSHILPLDGVDWQECHRSATSSMLSEVAGLFNRGILTGEISRRMGLCRATTIKYLKQATELGMCDYNPKTAHELGNNRAVKCLNNNKEFVSLSDCSRQSHDMFGFFIHTSTLSQVCLGRISEYKGLKFEYL